MGQGGSSSKGGSPKPGSDDWWWLKSAKLLSPLNTPEDFYQRFNTNNTAYAKIMSEFLKLGEGCPKGPDGLPQLTFEAFEKGDVDLDIPEIHNLHRKVFAAFDTDGNGVMSFNEYLLYDGIRSHGSLEQRIMGSFYLYDTDHDHKITRAEVTEIITCVLAICQNLDPEHFKDAMSKVPASVEGIFRDVDTDHSGTLELVELIEAARRLPNIARIFKVF